MKFIEYPEHLFECFMPPLPDELTIYHHPLYPISMYDGGIFFLHNDEWNINVGRNVGVTVSKAFDKSVTMEEFYEVFHKKMPSTKSKAIGTVRLKAAENLAWECYHGRVLPNNLTIAYFNNNPWDLRKDNLMSSLDIPTDYAHRAEYRERTKAFNDKTMNYIDNLVRRVAIPLGVDPIDYVNLLKLPTRLHNMWKKRYQKFGV